MSTKDKDIIANNVDSDQRDPIAPVYRLFAARSICPKVLEFHGSHPLY